MTKHPMKRQAPKSKESYWTRACFSRAWGSGLVRQLQRHLGVPGLRFPLRPPLALGSIDGAVAAEDGSTESVGDGSTAGAMAAAVHGSTAGNRLYYNTFACRRKSINLSGSCRLLWQRDKVANLLLPSSGLEMNSADGWAILSEACSGSKSKDC